jgi:drug/metabolite transporter (DMT)-like permease
MPLKNTQKATIALFLIAVIWGGTFPLIRNALHDIDASTFVVIRFTLSALFFLPFILFRKHRNHSKTLACGVVLGLFNGVAYFSQTVGLHYISSSESAFVTSTSVILIPLLMPLWRMQKPNPFEWIGAIICVGGIYFLTGGRVHEVSWAYGLTFLAALFTALAILFIQKISHLVDTKLLVFYQMLFTLILPLLFFHHQEMREIHWSGSLIMALLYCSIISTCVTLFLQAHYQRYTTATKTGIIFTLEPVFATLFAYYFNNESLSSAIMIGGALIISSLLVSEYGTHLHERSSKRA